MDLRDFHRPLTKVNSRQLCIMLSSDNMLCLLNLQLYHLLLIIGHMLSTLDHFPRLQIPGEVFLMALLSAVTGTADQLQVRYPPLMFFPLWMSIIEAGGSTHLSSPEQAATLLVLISPRYHQ